MMKLDDIRALAALMKETGLTELEYTEKGTSIKLGMAPAFPPHHEPCHTPVHADAAPEAPAADDISLDDEDFTSFTIDEESDADNAAFSDEDLDGRAHIIAEKAAKAANTAVKAGIELGKASIELGKAGLAVLKRKTQEHAAAYAAAQAEAEAAAAQDAEDEITVEDPVTEEDAMPSDAAVEAELNSKVEDK